MDAILFYITISFLSAIQSIAGVGVLVLGTPLMLILNYSIIEIMFFLLPISIVCSFYNLIFLNLNLKKKLIDFKLTKYFFIFCFPFVCIGLIIIKYFSELFNFNILVSVIIIFSIIIKIKFEKFFLNLKKDSKKIILSFIGIIHGLTNSGGTLLSLLIVSKNKKTLNSVRFEIHYFYFFIAITQLVVLFLFFDYILIGQINLFLIFLIVILSCFITNKLTIKIKNFVSNLIYVLAIISSIFLFIKGIF